MAVAPIARGRIIQAGQRFGEGSVETVVVYDTRYSSPQPAYGVSFVVPAPTPVYFAVAVTNTATLPSDYVTLIQNAIIAQFSGDNSNTPAGIGSLILASSYYGAVLAAVPGLVLLSIYVSLIDPATHNDVTMGIDQQPTLDASNITVTAV